MTNFEDQLLNDLMAKYQPALERSQLSPRTARRRAILRPAWLGAGAVGVATVATAAMVGLGGSPASAAYAVTPHADGTVTVAVYRASGVAGANAASAPRRALARAATGPSASGWASQVSPPGTPCCWPSHPCQPAAQAWAPGG
ncbi:MAG TPA: hypothetical protein DHU96_22750 [Actinobacteria bacterium]|nr:hypothetical protein [Actinomycetota bacterium]